MEFMKCLAETYSRTCETEADLITTILQLNA